MDDDGDGEDEGHTLPLSISLALSADDAISGLPRGLGLPPNPLALHRFVDGPRRL